VLGQTCRTSIVTISLKVAQLRGALERE